MMPSSEFPNGASSSSTHFRFRQGSSCELSEEEDNTVTMATMIEQQKKWMMEQGNPLQFQHNNLGSRKEEHVTIQGRKEEKYVTIQIEPDAPQMQVASAQSSFNHSGSMAHSESEIMSYAVPVRLNS
ncbi:hypothetical protein CKAN_01308500 [Cinnamomum micranthum f. kanehirae]|uniref:Uncharacterized protein n=1 Tax=Cinnamomum micranthum f. kanehirae TaxID=337451 RepID=A0A3S4P104_9MAGN|nr:hypothetical protein CKAN_01308500 [Cinnamomum micranthum f. kanehirae]